MSEELINIGDFKSIELVISMENTTSRTKIGPDKGVRLVEFLEHGFTLEVPKATCAQGHNLTIEIRRKGLPEAEDEPVTLTGKVEKLVRSGGVKGKAPSKDEVGDEPETFKAEIALVQYDEAEWAEFQKLFSSRQEEIEKFLAAVRGY